MSDDSPGENPYAAPAGDVVEPDAAPSLPKPISAAMYFYQYVVATFAFLFAVCLIYGLLTLFLVTDYLDTPASIPVHLSVYVVAIFLARRHLRRSLARLRRE